MKKVSSVVWQFFDRIQENGRCTAVLCKLCDTVYKFFGNTTNLRVHLVKKHPLQWEFRQNNLDGKSSVDESSRSRVFDEDESNQSTISAKRTKFVNVRAPKESSQYTLSIKNPASGRTEELPVIEIQRVETEGDNEIPDDDITTINMVRQLHEEHASDEEWLEDEIPINRFKSKPNKLKRKIKREVTSPPHYPQYQQRYSTPKKIITQEPSEAQPKDEYSVFGEYIANKLRKLKAPLTRGNVQQLITTIIWQAEYGMYDDADTVKRLLMASMETPAQQSAQETEEHTAGYTLQVERNVDENNQSVESEVADVV